MFNWITGFVEQFGYPGVFLLMLAENVFPPIPSELIMPLAGFTAAQGNLHIVLVTLAGTAGSLLGALVWYYVGRWLGLERLKRTAAGHGRWLAVSPQDLDRVEAWFRRHGAKAVFIGRLVPAVRTLISVPAGICGMPLGRFLTWTALGTTLWTSLLTIAGFLLEDQYGRVAEWIGPVSNVIFGVIAAAYFYRVLTFKREVRGS